MQHEVAGCVWNDWNKASVGGGVSGDKLRRSDHWDWRLRRNNCPCTEKRPVRGETTGLGSVPPQRQYFFWMGSWSAPPFVRCNAGKLFNATRNQSQSHLVLSYLLTAPVSFSPSWPLFNSLGRQMLMDTLSSLRLNLVLLRDVTLTFLSAALLIRRSPNKPLASTLVMEGDSGPTGELLRHSAWQMLSLKHTGRHLVACIIVPGG